MQNFSAKGVNTSRRTDLGLCQPGIPGEGLMPSLLRPPYSLGPGKEMLYLHLMN